MSASWALLITCEHGGNDVPPGYAELFASWRDLLASHRGYDAGALATAEVLSTTMDAPLVAATVSRLVVDLNRSIGHPRLFSEITKPLPTKTKKDILASHYYPHRQAVTAVAEGFLAQGKRVLHIASHSFTPRLGGIDRHCDIGLLYDPKRTVEKTFCLRWLEDLARLDGGLVLRRNFPYRGVADGLVTALRRCFGEAYLGVELEVSQRFVQAGDAVLAGINTHLAHALARVLREFPPATGSRGDAAPGGQGRPLT